MAGSSNLTQQQLLEAVWVLLQNISVPFQSSYAELGLFVNGANQLQFPDNAYNQAGAASLVASADGVNIYISNVEGNPTSGA